MNETVTTTKERVLDAANACPTAKATLTRLFPDVFREEYDFYILVNWDRSINYSTSYPSITRFFREHQDNRLYGMKFGTINSSLGCGNRIVV